MKRILLLSLTALVASTALLGAAPAGAAEPWWQLLTGSRPSNLAVAPDQTEVQEVKTAKSGGVVVATVEVGGELIGCLGAGETGGLPADLLCELNTEFLFSAAETAAELEEMLEGPYGAGEVEVTGGPVGTAPLLITTPGRWVPPVEITPGTLSLGETTVALGSSSAEVKSEGSGRLVVTLTNLGNASLDASGVPLELVDQLPEGAQAYGLQVAAGGQGKAGPVDCIIETTALVNCTFDDELPPYEAIELEVLVALTPEAVGGEAGEVSVSGGNGPAQSAPQTLNLSEAEVPFGLEEFSMVAEEEGGKPTTQAGAHPFQLTTTVVARSGAQSGANRRNARVAQPSLPRNLRFTLPAGLVGSATAVPTCDLTTFLFVTTQLVNNCPDDSAIGVASVTVIESNVLGLVRLAVPVFNLPPQQGEPARFGVVVAGAPVVIGTSVDPSDEYRITAEVRNVSQIVQFLAATTTIWGNPGSAAHDASRGWNCAYFGASEIPGECEVPATRNDTPFLRMPTRCADPLAFEVEFEPWNVPVGSVVEHSDDESGEALKGCNKVPFDPTISAALTSKLAENPTGLEFELSLPNAGLTNPKAEASEAQPKKVEVTLPEGVTVNPSQAEGLATCSEAQLANERYDSAPGEGCPEASKIGSIEGTTPLIEETLHGSLYIAEPFENPLDSLIALYIVARVPERGVLVKQAGLVEPDPRTGQLISTFDDLPQLPYDNFKLRFREGGRAPLVSPPRCGSFETTARFVPWSAQDPENPTPEEIVERSAQFEVLRGVDGGACPGGGVPPFEPGFSAGTLNNQAGALSPFLMRLTRKDGDQDMTRFSSVLPPGVLASIAGLGRCSDAAIAAAPARSGKAELAAPSCPASSRIGSTLAGAGVGSVLTYVPGSLYLAGPVGGAPLSVVAITPAVAGPFDVGTVVVRVALRVNPVTARVEVDGAASDPIPHILAGIPLKLRDLRVRVDRPDFTRNATSCEPSETVATLWGGFADVFSTADDIPTDLTARYQAAGCQALGFKPKLAIKLKGGTKRGDHPALKAIVTPRPGDANFARAEVALPRSAFLDQAHIRTICTRVQFAAGAGNGAQCPKGAQYGYARVWTPILDEPAQGPVFLRSSNHNLPDLVFALQGPPSAAAKVEISARIDSIRGGIRSTFEAIPDVPVSRFVLEMQGGRKGLLVNSRNLCFKPNRNRARAKLVGQNGRRLNTRPVVRAVGCGKGSRRGKRR